MNQALKRVYLFIGPPGSGKGTLSNLLTRAYDFVQLSTGDLLRKHIVEQTDIGKQIDFAIKSGKLVTDSLVNAIVEQWFTQIITQSDDIILDGYPRTIAQAEAFDAYLQAVSIPLEVRVIRFCISDDEVIERIAGRLMCQNKECQKVYSANENSHLAPKLAMKCDACGSALGRRNDDAASLIKERLIVYHKHEQDLLKFYKDRNYRIVEINVGKPFDVVVDDFKQMVGI